jgi:hypothetical protein
MKRSTKNLLIAGVVVGAAVGGVVWYQKAYAAPAVPTNPLPAGSITPVTSFTNGTKYTFLAQIPTGVSDSTTLTNALTAAGWTNVNVLYFMGTGTIPAGFPAIATNGYAASGTWNGTSGAGVPAGVVAAATP